MNIIALVCFIWTCFAYVVAKKIYRRKPWMCFSPAITVPISTIVLMIIFGISYQEYHLYTRWIVAILGPATVAFAIPIYEYREVIRRQILILAVAIVVGMVVGVISSYILAHIFQFSPEVTNSLMARSVSTPFAIELADEIHGSATLVSLFTILTGLMGMILGDVVLMLCRSKFRLANGVAFGNAAHGFGTSRAAQRNENEGVIASLTMVLAGLFMVLVGPWIVKLVVWL